MENDYERCPATPNPPAVSQIDSAPRRRTVVLASAAGILLASGGIVAALTLSAGAQLANSPEAAATTVTATPWMPRPQYTAEAPSVPGQTECTPNVLRRACSPSRDLEQSAALAWFNEAKSPYTAIQDAVQAATTEMQDSNMDGVRSACQQLRSSSQKLGHTLPSPDQALTAEVQGAVDELITAADLCLAPDATSNVQALMSHVEQANSHFSNAQQIIEGKS
jgi:hypothetical protein